MNLFRNNYSLWVAKAPVAVFAVLGMLAVSPVVYGQSAPAGKNDTAKGGKGAPPTVMELEVADPINTRYGLMAACRGLDSEFVFKQGPNVGGQEEFSASDSYNTSVEIIGSKNEPQTVKWTISFTANRDVNIKETFRLANFLDRVSGQDAVQWFNDQYPKNLKAHPLDDYTETNAFEYRKIKFEYRPRLRQASMTVFMKK